MNKKKEFAFIGLAILSISILVSLMYSQETKETIVVDRVDFQQEVIGDKDNLRTEYYYRVYTDKGIYEIAQKGILFAHPELISKVHKGDTLSITARGYNIVALGIYPFIVDIHD